MNSDPSNIRYVDIEPSSKGSDVSRVLEVSNDCKKDMKTQFIWTRDSILYRKKCDATDENIESFDMISFHREVEYVWDKGWRAGSRRNSIKPNAPMNDSAVTVYNSIQL